jgi:hypothetical protein
VQLRTYVETFVSTGDGRGAFDARDLEIRLRPVGSRR